LKMIDTRFLKVLWLIQGFDVLRGSVFSEDHFFAKNL